MYVRLAVRRHAHDLVLAVVHLEAEEGGEGRVEQAERVREARLLEQLDAVLSAPSPQVALPTPSVAGGPLADAVDGQDRRLLERRAEEGAGGVRQVVLDEQDPSCGTPAGCG